MSTGAEFGACFWEIKLRVHTSPPLSSRNDLTVPVPLQGADIGIPARGYSTAMEACIRRVWVEHPPLPAKALEELRRSLAEWEAWKQSRAEQVGRIIAVRYGFRSLRGTKETNACEACCEGQVGHINPRLRRAAVCVRGYRVPCRQAYNWIVTPPNIHAGELHVRPRQYSHRHPK